MTRLPRAGKGLSGTRLTRREPLKRLNVPFMDLWAVHQPILSDLRKAFERVLTNSSFNQGDEVRVFERALAELVGTTHAVGVASGTAALHLSLVAAGIGHADEVVLPPNSFFATAEAVLAAGATPVFADVNLQTALLDPSAAEAAVTDRTAAIIPVHLYGQTAPMDAFASVAERHGLFLLEDAAQAISATWEGRQAGSLGHAAAFSFYPGKNLGALGEAGAVTTSDPDLARRVALLGSHGEASKNVHVCSGFNERLDGLQAAFLSTKLPHLFEAQRLRLEAVSLYQGLLGGMEGVELLHTAPRAGHAYHLLVLRVAHRDRVLEALRSAGVVAGIHYPTPIHLQPACHHLGGRRGQFPHAEDLACSVISLPLFAGMTEEQIEYAVDSLRMALEYTT